MVPPSGLKPYASAMPSKMVDLPVPFSPTKNVTGEVNSKSVILLTEGISLNKSPHLSHPTVYGQLL